MSNEVVIVSGLPRSGTSMMMQALENGGLEALTDNIRQADLDNPKGYYEFEPVKKTKQDPSWLENASGKVVKMVYRLLYDLPAGYSYKVVFMKRHLDEVLVSQRKMLERTGKEGAKISDDKLAALFKAELDKFTNWLDQQENFDIIYIQYRDVIENPAEQFKKINVLLDNRLDVDAMTAAVDPSLYRNKA